MTILVDQDLAGVLVHHEGYIGMQGWPKVCAVFAQPLYLSQTIALRDGYADDGRRSGFASSQDGWWGFG